MKCGKDGSGYLQIGVINNTNNKFRFLAHRLVAIAFIAKINGKDFVNHKNGRKYDNRADNLEWCTKSENSKHAILNGLQIHKKGQGHPMCKFSNEIITEIRSKYIFRKYGSTKLAREFSMSVTNVKDILNKKIWSHI